jgi:hypothetical protein
MTPSIEKHGRISLSCKKSSDNVPSPRGAGRGIGRGALMGKPPLPAPLLHKYVEEREKDKVAKK